MPEVLLVDDHQLLATSVSTALRANGIDAEVLAPRPLPELVHAVVEHGASLVLLDLDLGCFGDSVPAIAPLTDAGVRVLVVTGHDDPMRIAAALEQGAIGHRSKLDPMHTLVDTVRRALSCDAPLEPVLRVQLLEELRRTRRRRARELAPFAALTERERETLRALARGSSVRDIADAWFVSEATVRTHVRSLLQKIGAHSQLAAVTMAMRAGYLELDDLVPTG